MTNTDQSFEKLENALADAGRLIDYPPVPSFASRAQSRQSTPRLRISPKSALALAILIVLALIATPETRNALSQAFGFGNWSKSPLTTPTLTTTAQPNPGIMITLTSLPPKQTPTTQSTHVGTPSTSSNPADIRGLAKPIVRSIEITQAK